MYSRKTETHRLLGRLIGQPMFRTLSWFCLYSSKLEYFGGAEGSKKGIQHVEATSSLLFVLEVVREINSTTLLIKASRSVWHNYFPLYITLQVRTYECWVQRFSPEKLGSLDFLSNSGKQQSQFSQDGFSFCVLHCIWQAVRIQMKCRIRCGISSGSTLSAKTTCGQLLFYL